MMPIDLVSSETQQLLVRADVSLQDQISANRSTLTVHRVREERGFVARNNLLSELYECSSTNYASSVRDESHITYR